MSLSSYLSAKRYRLMTILTAIKAIYRFSPEQVNKFVKSYKVYRLDWSKGQAVDGRKKIPYAEVKQDILSWYTVINHLCALGEVEKMYIPPAMDLSKSIIDNQNLFEEQMSQQLGLGPDSQVFELGCGKGRVAAHVAKTSGANIIGINIDQGQLNSAQSFAERQGLTEYCHYLNADFNEIPFPYPNNHFDAIYEIQVLSLSSDLNKLFKELYRILKPGGRISLLEWVKLPKFDPNKPSHQNLMKKIKPLIGAIGTPSPEDYEKALTKAGFQLLISADPSVNHSQEPLIRKANHFFAKLRPLFKFLVKIKLFPEHFITLFDRLSKNTEALCKADKMGLITMCHQLVAEKPLRKRRTNPK